MSLAVVTPFPTRPMVKHGCSTPENKKLYDIWYQERGRCHNPEHPKYPAYGGRGIQMCAEWREDVAAFVDYVISALGSRPDGCSLDRIDNDGNYAPGNLKWSTPVQQANNKRTNRFVTYRRSRYTVAEFSRMIGREPKGVLRSLNRGKSPEQIAAFHGFNTVLPIAA